MRRRWRRQAKLKREFEEFGAIKSLRVVHSATTGKPRGYAFIEYHSSRDMKNAYKVPRPARPSLCTFFSSFTLSLTHTISPRPHTASQRS
jgi:RNA recognition motif-containing protein